MSHPIGDRNLLFGILALQKGFVPAEVVVAAMKGWVLDKRKGLAQILREQRALSENHHALLEESVDTHLAQHGNDAAKSLAAVTWIGSLHDDLNRIADADVQASIAHVATAQPAAEPAAPTIADGESPIIPATDDGPPWVTPIELAAAKPPRMTPKRPAKDQAGGTPAWALIVGGVGVGIVVAVLFVAMLAGVVVIALKTRPAEPVVEVRFEEAKVPPQPVLPPVANKGKPLPPDPPKPLLVVPPQPVVATPGFTLLFNGKDLTGWKQLQQPGADWRVENGILIGTAAEKAMSRLYTEQAQPRDFHLRIEARIGAQGAGKICFRSPDGTVGGYELPFGMALEGGVRVGTLHAQIPGKGIELPRIVNSVIPPDQWFTLEVIAVENRLIVKVDGKTTTDVSNATISAAGHIALGQLGPSKLEFRRLEIKELKPAIATPFTVTPGFTPLFNGKDLTGWKPQVHPQLPGIWRVENGVLVGSSFGKGTYMLYTDRPQPRDFHLRVEASVNDQGWGTLRFCCPDGSILGYETPLNSTFPLEVKTGSLRAQVPGKRIDMILVKKTPVQPDQWFTLEIIAEGERLTVKVDGQTTADVATFNHPIKSGHLALFQSGLSRLEFRRIEIKEIAPGPAIAVARMLELKGGGASVFSNLAANDPRYQGRKISKTFLYPMEAGKTYQIDQKSKAFDCYLILEDPDGKRVAEDDDGGGDLDARIIYKATKTGKYRIVATSLMGTSTGQFTLTIRESGAGTPAPPRPLEPFVALFNGKDLTGWRVEGNDGWKVNEAGELVGQGPDTALISKRDDYRNFIARIELSASGDADAFLAFRQLPGLKGKVIALTSRLIGDGDSVRAGYAGVNAMKFESGNQQIRVKPDETFLLEIEMKPDGIRLKANGKATGGLNYAPERHPPGAIGLFITKGTVRIKKFEISAEEPFAPPPLVAAGEFVPLFNGKDLTGWETHKLFKGDWRVDNGILTGSGPTTAYLYTTRGDFKDTHLRAEVRFTGGEIAGVGGVLCRSPMGLHGYEAMIHFAKKTGGGSLASKAGLKIIKGMPAPIEPGEWFTLEVLTEGNQVKVKVNGTTTSEFADEKNEFPTGHIALHQRARGVIEFRKIEIRDLKPAVEPPPLVAVGDFVPLFNGKDLDGWQPHAKKPGNWRVDNGVATGSSPVGGSLYTTRGDFKDFHLRAEARINDKGFSRIFVRAEYDPLKVPIKTIGYEALINQRPVGAKTGALTATSPIKMTYTPAKDSPPLPNEWFTLEVLARGERVSTKVNGVLVAEFVDAQNQFARNGHIVLHQDPNAVIEFRRVEIRELRPAGVGGVAPGPQK